MQVKYVHFKTNKSFFLLWLTYGLQIEMHVIYIIRY